MIDKECILFDILVTSKYQAIKTMVQKLSCIGSITGEEEFYRDVLNREDICATAIGDEIALPHGRTRNVLRPSICFGRLLEPVVWNEKTQEKVRFVILIAVPSEGATEFHLKIISQLARKLMHREYRAILLNGTQEEVYKFLNESIVMNE